MKKSLVLIIAILAFAINANAQHEKGTNYLQGSLSGFDLSYNGTKHLDFNADFCGGYFVSKHIALLGDIGYGHVGRNQSDAFHVGVGTRAYISALNLYLGVNAKMHFSAGNTDFMPGMEIGYTWYLDDKLAIEPAIYYDQSFHNHEKYSTAGLKIGFGYYF